MKFIVTDRQGIEAGVLVRSAYIVVSISDPGSRRPKAKKQSGLRDVLHLTFHDTEPPTTASMVLMTPKQAGQIVDFVERHQRDVETVVVHCEAGMSRSPAVAAALCKSMGGDDRQFWRNFTPNVYVYKLVCEAAKGTFK
jgi:predicted protein tyrosine phosphatase